MVTQSKLAVLLHADVVGSTALVQADERLAHEGIQEAFQHLAQSVDGYGGTTLEIRGDALVAEFSRASDAVIAALTFQQQYQKGNVSLPDQLRPEVRIGVALGEVVIADRTVTGAGVVLAQRLEQLAPPGGLCISAAVHEAVPRRLPLTFENLGDHELKGFDEPIRAYQVKGRVGVVLPLPEARGDDIRSAVQQPVERADYGGVHGPRVAVLPFRNLSPDPEQEFFAAGLSDEITLALTASRSFPVLANSATARFKDHGTGIGAAVSELGAQYILHGNVRRAGSRLRVSVELVHGESQLQVWSERYDRHIDDVFDIQDEITTAVAATVEPEIDAQEMRRVLTSHPNSLNSYEIAQQGFWHLGKRTREGYIRSLELFDQSLHVDPQFGRAHAGVAQGKYNAALHAWEERAAALETAVQRARTALDLDDRDPRGLRYFGGASVALGRHDEGLQALRRAIAVQPSYATAYSALAFGLALVGEFEEAVTAEATTSRLRPGDRAMNVCMMSKSIATYEMGDYETAEQVSRRSLDLSDAFWLSSLMLAASLGQQGRTEEAHQAAERVYELLPGLSERDLATLLPFKQGEHLAHILEGLHKARLALH
jgi:TolB-like protein/class 3 adenylate cyclase/Flp pilus assembly protein TadD